MVEVFAFRSITFQLWPVLSQPNNIQADLSNAVRSRSRAEITRSRPRFDITSSATSPNLSRVLLLPNPFCYGRMKVDLFVYTFVIPRGIAK